MRKCCMLLLIMAATGCWAQKDSTNQLNVDLQFIMHGEACGGGLPRSDAGQIMVEDKSNYFTEGEASYLICEKQKLTKDEFDKLCDDLGSPNKYCKEFEPLDLDNYSYNVIEFSCDDYDFTLLVDPSNYDYCRYVAKVGGNE